MNDSHFETGAAFAATLDASDPLASFRDEFLMPRGKDGKDCVYLCGNSLGLQPRLAHQYVNEELEDWATLGVEGHLHARRPWLPYHRQATAGLASLTGSQTQEVVAMNTLTVNLHLMMASFYRPDAKRRKIVIEATAFPSDRFAVQSQLRHHGHDPAQDLIEWRPRGPNGPLAFDDLEDIVAAQGDEIALLLLPGVQYYNGQVLPMERLCELAQRTGCRIGLDLAHAIGNVELKLHDWGPDFAVWCSYKYMNSGPGAVGGAFVHARHLDNDNVDPLLGWWGHDERTRFEMAPSFTPAPGAELWQLSNPPILSLAPLIASLELFERAGIQELRQKSQRMSAYFDFLLSSEPKLAVSSITPADARGCQFSLVVDAANHDPKRVFDSLTAQDVIADWREPDVIRAAPVPLYNSFADIEAFVTRLQAAMAEQSSA